MEKTSTLLPSNVAPGAAGARYRSTVASELLVALGDLGVAQERQAPNEALEQLSSRVRTALRLFQDHLPTHQAA